MITKVKTAISNPLLANTAIVTIGTVIASFFSYLLQIALGRMLNVESYGTFNALLSLSVIVAFPLMPLVNSVIKTVSELKAQDKFDTLTHLFVKLSITFSAFGMFVFWLIYFFSGFLADYLQVYDKSLFLFFGLYLGLTFLIAIPSGYLQGLLRFKAFAFFSVTGSFVRLVFPLILVYMGFGLYGVFGGFVGAIVFTFIVSLFLLKKNFWKFEKQSLSEQYKKLVRFGVYTLFIGVGMTLLNNVDLVLVKHYFDPTTAGLYSAVVTVGKVFLFGAGTVTLLMYPQITELFTRGVNYKSRFKQFLMLQTLLVVVGMITFYLFSGFITKIMFGETFLFAAQYLPLFSVFVGLYILINFFVMFLLAINLTKVFVFFIPTAIGQYLLISWFHNSLSQVIMVNTVVSGLLLLAVIVYYVKHARINNNSGL